jgi:hypothetical protein
VEWSGLQLVVLSDLSGLEWTGLDWTGLEWSGLQLVALSDLSGLEWTGLEWSGLQLVVLSDLSGLEWTGLDWTGLEWTPVGRAFRLECILGRVHWSPYGVQWSPVESIWTVGGLQSIVIVQHFGPMCQSCRPSCRRN